jgi:uncharacterized protein YjbJ (UPF0337 family)
LPASATIAEYRRPIHDLKEHHMNWEQIEGKWDQAKGKIKEKWGKLTDDDIAQINGKRDQLAGRIRERYGYTKERAEDEMKAWENDSRW